MSVAKFLQKMYVIQFELLQFVNIKQIGQLGLTSKHLNKMIDSNKSKHQNFVQNKMSNHLEIIVSIQMDIKKNQFNQIKQIMQDYMGQDQTNAVKQCLYLKDLQAFTENIYLFKDVSLSLLEMFQQQPQQKIEVLNINSGNLDDKVIKIWKRQGPLNFLQLIKDSLWKPTNHECVTEYKKTKWIGSFDAVFIGQTNENGNPDGLCRVISKLGLLWEGQTTTNCCPHGWGRFLFISDYHYIGWRNENTGPCGNGIKFDDNGNLTEQGWWQNHKLINEFDKENNEFKYFQYQKYLQNGVL